MSGDPFEDVPFPEDIPDYHAGRIGADGWTYRDPTAQPSSVPEPAAIEAARFVWIEPNHLPKREWVLDRHLIRKFISVTVSPGGVGKSSLVIAEALALATGRDLIGHAPHGTFRVWMWNGEDPLDELQRRVIAAAMHYGLDEADIEDRLFVNSGRDTRILVAEQRREGAVVAVPVVEAIKATIQANRIDVVIIDPFVSCHAVSENDNGAIDRVASLWADIADQTGCAIELVHHARKTGGNEVPMEDLRGAVSLLSKARAGRVLNAMSREEAAKAGVELRRLHFRVDEGKGNLAPPSTDASTWFKLTSVSLGNGGGFGGIEFDSDSVGVVTPWQWPDPLDGVRADDLRACQAAVRGGVWRENVQARDWVGKAIGPVLKLDPDDSADREKIKRLLKVWLANGMFQIVTGKDDKGNPRPFVEVGEAAAD